MILLTWTVSSGQTGTPDTVKCYGVSELQRIAAALVKGSACDTLLYNASLKLSNRDSLIHLKDTVIFYQTTQLDLKEKIIQVKHEELWQADLHLKKEMRRNRWLKFAWGSTSVILGGALVYFILN